MKKLCLILVLAILAPPILAQEGLGGNQLLVMDPIDYDGPGHVPDEIIVKFKPGVSRSEIAKINSQHGTSVIYTSPFAGFKRFKIPKGLGAAKMVEILSKNPNVEYAEFNYIAIAYALLEPDDPLYSYQWHLDDQVDGGNPYGGTNGGGINVEPAWDISTGVGVTVAVIDTGVADSPSEDDLEDSRVIAGYDFVNNDNDPTDDNGHGTHVAGTIAQSTDNGIGVAGVAYDCTIMPVKVLNKRGSGPYADIADGIYYAADNGAEVINMSLGGPYPSDTLEIALAYAYNKGVTIICSSGNDGENQVGYPAAYDAYCIAVGATTYNEAVASYSNGGDSLDLTAPGGDGYDMNGDGYIDGVLQQTFQRRTWGYYFFYGTSMAAPHVSGVAALVISNGVTSPDDVRAALESTAEDKGTTGWDSEYGCGIVDAYAALQWGGGSALPDPPVAVFSATPTSGDAPLLVKFTDESTGATSWLWDFGDGETSTEQNPSYTYSDSGTYTVTLTATNNDGSDTAIFEYINVHEPALNQPPTADFTFTISDLTVDFTDASIDDDSIMSWDWDFEDNDYSFLQNPQYVYDTAGTYLVTLTVTDNDGETDSVSKKVTVTEAGEMAMHVDSINMFPFIKNAGKNIFIGVVAIVAIYNADGQPVEGATVYGSWSDVTSGIDYGKDYGITNASGEVELTSDAVRNPEDKITFTFTVDNVVKSSWTYDSGANVETSDLITVP